MSEGVQYNLVGNNASTIYHNIDPQSILFHI
jgi:hypothetical protein